MSGFAFDSPWWLLLLPLLLVVLLRVAAKSRRPLTLFRRRAALGLRLVATAVVVLALAGLVRWRRDDRLTVVFAVDQSRSVGREGREETRGFLSEAAAALPEHDEAGVVTFGGDAMVESTPAAHWKAAEILTRPDPDASDIGAAVRLARGLVPPGQEGRVVLVTDGLETRGSVFSSVSEAAPDLDVVWKRLPRSTAPEVLVDSVRAPERVDAGEPFRVTVTLRASRAGDAQLTLARDGRPVSSGRVALDGTAPNVFQIEERAPQASGAVVYEARVSAAEDGSPENNRASTIVRVEGAPRVLLVDRRPESLAPLSGSLTRAGIACEARGPGALPADLVGLASYDAVVLSDVASTSFSDGQLEALRAYVEVLGGGLTMLGGPESFGPGGWVKTPVEAVLPLDMEVKNKSTFPSLGIVLLIDKSGSMAGMGEAAKIEVAKAAASEVIALLSSMDFIGVVAFDDEAKWVVPMSPGTEKDNALSLLGTLRAGGGTDAYPAMEEAKRALSKTTTRVKHVILLTDGQLAGRDHEGLARAMAAQGITLSTVGVGTDADLYTLEKIAGAGKGRFYRAEDVAVLPRIFLREAFQVARSFLVEEPFTPVLRRDHAVLSGVSSLPRLLGYVAASEKPGAEHLLGTHKDDPLLSVMHAGLGRTAAFTSDAKGRWGSAWLSWSGYDAFWARLLRWTLRGAPSGRLRVSAEPNGGRLRVAADLVDDGGDFVNGASLRALTVSSEGEKGEAALAQVAPGRYEADLPATRAGAYLVAVLRDGKQGLVEGATTSAVVPYSDEFRGLSSAPDALERLVAAGRVKEAGPPRSLFAHRGKGSRVRTSLIPHLLSLAAFLLVAEIAVRRLRMPGRAKAPLAVVAEEGGAVARTFSIEDARARAGSHALPRTAPEKSPEKAPEAPADDYTTRLLEAKRRSRR